MGGEKMPFERFAEGCDSILTERWMYGSDSGYMDNEFGEQVCRDESYRASLDIFEISLTKRYFGHWPADPKAPPKETETYRASVYHGNRLLLEFEGDGAKGLYEKIEAKVRKRG